MSAGANELLITKTDDSEVTITGLTTIASSAAYTGQVAKGDVKAIDIGTDITSIGNDTFKDCTELLTATIGNKVTTIAINVFNGCTKLTTVTFTATSTLATIGGLAFRGCSALQSMTIGNSVTSIGEMAFLDCTALDTLTFAATSTLTDIGQFAFSRSALTSVSIPDSVTSLGQQAFDGCSKLDTVFIGDGLTTINTYMFNNCIKLQFLRIGNAVTSIDTFAFTNAGSGLASGVVLKVRMGSAAQTALSLTYGTGQTFRSSVSATIVVDTAVLIITNTNSGTADEVVSSKTTLSASDYTTTASAIKTISIWPEITQLNADAFKDCTALTTVNFAGTNTVTDIGNSAFQSCTELTSITIPASVDTIGDSTFLNAGLTSVTIPNAVTSLGTGVFKNTELQSMTIGSGISALPDNTFHDCDKLQSVTIPSTIRTIGNNAFNGCSNASFTSLTIHTAITSIGTSAFKTCTGLQTLTFTATSTLTTIDVDAFFGCTGLTSVSIPDSVTSLGTGAFRSCTSLDTVVIGSELTSIGANTFTDCDKLRRTTIGDKVASIANDAFTSAGSAAGVVLQVKMSASRLTALTLSYGVGVAFRGATGVTIVAEFVAPAPLPPDASCFPGNTPVQTDQGIVNICDLCPAKHTIRGNKIETVTQNTGIEDFLILIKKDTLYANVPSQDTYTTFDHIIFVNKQNVRAGVLETRAQDSGIPDLMNRIYQVPYNGQVLYNVLLKDDKHDYMCVNNLIVETMNPKNIFAKYYCYLKNKKQGEENIELEESYKKYSSMTHALVKKHKRSKLSKK